MGIKIIGIHELGIQYSDIRDLCINKYKAIISSTSQRLITKIILDLPQRPDMRQTAITTDLL